MRRQRDAETNDLFLFSFRDAGKGLGKNENGITEPVKLVNNQNKTGIGYREDEAVPWYEAIYNKACKNVKVETVGDEVSLTLVDGNDRGLATKTSPLGLYNTFLMFHKMLDENVTDKQDVKEKVESESTLAETCTFKQQPTCNRTMDKIMERNRTLCGKLKRIEEQDRILLNHLQTDLTPVMENMAYRKTNIESDVEENEPEVNDNENTSQFEEKKYVKSKTKKRYRRKINRLADQLSTCNLEENNAKRDFRNNKKLAQKMKKTKEKKIDSGLLLKYLECCEKIENTLDQTPTFVSMFNVNGPKDTYINCSRYLKTMLEAQKKNINKLKISVPQCKNEKDGIWHKIEFSPELKKSIASGKINDLYDMEKLIIDSKKQKEEADCKSIISVTHRSKNDHFKDSEYLKHSLLLSKINQIEISTRKMRKTQEKSQIKKKKELCCHSKRKEGINKIAEKLKGEALAQELNSLIKNLTTFGLAEKVNRNIIKRPTQTHLTPV